MEEEEESSIKSNFILWPGKTITLQSYRNEQVIGYLVNVRATIETEYFSKPHQEYRYYFQVDSIKWKLRMYPHGRHDKCNGYISVYLMLESTGDYKLPLTVNADFRYGIGRLTEPIKFSELTRIWGLKRFAKIEDEPITLNFVLRYIKDDGNRNSDSPSQEFISCSPWTYDGSLLGDPDVQLKAANGTYPTYKSVLSDISSKFSKILDADKYLTEIKLSLNGEAVELFINFLRTGRLDYSDDRTLEELVAFGNHFSIPILKTACDQQLSLN